MNSKSESEDMGLSKRAGSFRSPSKPKQSASNGLSKTGACEASEAGDDARVGTSGKGESEGESGGGEGDEEEDTTGEGVNIHVGVTEGDVVEAGEGEHGSEGRSNSEPSSDMNI